MSAYSNLSSKELLDKFVAKSAWLIEKYFPLRDEILSRMEPVLIVTNRTALSEQDYLDLKENVRLINAGHPDVTMEEVQETVGDLLGALAGANDLAEIALSRMSEHERKQPIGAGLTRLRDYVRTLQS